VFEVRSNAHLAIEMTSEEFPGGRGVLASGLVPVLVEKLKTEEDEIKELILDTLHNCMRIDATPTLDCKAMAVFTGLLNATREGVRARAARNIMDLSFPLAGKEQACACDAVSHLVQQLSDHSSKVRAHAAGALMSISITTQGKYACIKAEAIPALVGLLSDENTDVRLNVIKAITTLAEAPEGRTALHVTLPKLKELYDINNEMVVKAAKTAVEVIEWRP
jgi:HEAT repeat protein